jgi:hypothetical protein
LANKTIVRVVKNKDNPYVMLNKYFLDREPEMSWKAKGMLTYLLSKPDNWTIMVCDLIKKASDGKDAVYSGLKELQKNKYIYYQKVRDERGRIIKHEYLVYETPYTENPEMDNPEMEKPDTDNPPLLNNDIPINEDNNNQSYLIEFDSIDALINFYEKKYNLPYWNVLQVYDRVVPQYKEDNIKKSFTAYFEAALKQEKEDYERNKFID